MVEIREMTEHEVNLMNEILAKRNSMIFLLMDDNVIDIYNKNIEKLKNDQENIFLHAMIEYLSSVDVITNKMRARGYEMVNELFFNKEYRNHDRIELINEIKGFLNNIKVNDYEFYRNKFYEYNDADIFASYETDLKFEDELLKKECQVNNFIYSLSSLSEDDYMNYEFDEGCIFFINYLVNDCKEAFLINNFKIRCFLILQETKAELKECKREIPEYKAFNRINNKIIKKAKKI